MHENPDNFIDDADVHGIGHALHRLMGSLFPICRSITGDGVRRTLEILSEHIPLEVKEVPSGTPAFDWTVPKEWNIREAYVEAEDGQRIVDFQKCNLHVVGYSCPVNEWVSLEELQEHMHSLEDQPDAIPYVTSYYKENWGFCIKHSERAKLKDEKYHVVIESELKEGHLTYGELIIPGTTGQEVFLSTYVCHPSMANNELSGPVVLAHIARWLLSVSHRYTYRLVFIPETIGSIVYLSQHLEEMKHCTVLGFNLSCIGDECAFGYVASPYGNTLADRIAENVLKHHAQCYIKYSFLERGSDERQYCSPGVDLPLVTLCRSKYGTYPEYHTSLDDMTFVTPRGLAGGFHFVKRCIEAAEANVIYRVICCGEPQLGKRGLYPTLSTRTSGKTVATMMDLITYADGTNDLVAISDMIGAPVGEVKEIALRLESAGLLKEVEKGSVTRSCIFP